MKDIGNIYIYISVTYMYMICMIHVICNIYVNSFELYSNLILYYIFERLHVYNLYIYIYTFS